MTVDGSAPHQRLLLVTGGSLWCVRCPLFLGVLPKNEREFSILRRICIFTKKSIEMRRGFVYNYLNVVFMTKP